MDIGVPEIEPGAKGLVRIPNELDVPVTRRVLRILDSPPMQRLKRVSQLGLVAQVYPGAGHSRFEHSLGVYRLAVQVLEHLMRTDTEFAESISVADAKVYLLASLVHDIGHWPYCHPIEDLGLAGVPEHEELARQHLCEGILADMIREDWEVEPGSVADFLVGETSGASPARAVLHNVLNGPIDIDKMDYLQRDSLHAGVPYGRNFDIGRLIGSLCVQHDRGVIALSEKGKTAAEMMVFARYVMFSEVYWHHAVRSATAMLQRLVFELSGSQPASFSGASRWTQQSDAEFEAELLGRSVVDVGLQAIAESIFGKQRSLYKRLVQFDVSSADSENARLHSLLAGRPFGELVSIARQLAEKLGEVAGVQLRPTDLLLDAPPVKLEVQFRLQVARSGQGAEPLEYVSLESISPVVKTLATEQFDNYVKRVRVFASPRVADSLKPFRSKITTLLLELAEHQS